MSGEPSNNTTIDPTLLQRLTQNYQTPNQLSGFSQLNISADSNDNSSDGAINIGSPNSSNRPPALSVSYSTMNDPSSGTAPININRSNTLGTSANQQLSGSAASFGTDYDRSGIANSFQQLQQHHFQQQQQHPHQNLFRPQLGSPVTQQEIFSPVTDDLADFSPVGSYAGGNLTSMAPGALPTSIPSSMLGNQRSAAGTMLGMQRIDRGSPQTPAYQSMSLPTHSEWLENHLMQQQTIGSALNPSSFATAQQIGGTSAADFSPNNQTLMSLMESDDVDTTHKSALQVYEKRRRRRESHNAVERRRRDNINDRIQELFTLLPETMIDQNAKPNKGMILKKSVEYIRQLQHMLQNQNSRLHELESGIPSSMAAAAAAAAAAGQPHQSQASGGLAAMLAGAAGINAPRSQHHHHHQQGGDGGMTGNGL
ncbi:hypothetical protein LPJ72_005418 [Coemansia sp. Benny D160-2]|nr:hypothetical protein LPJ72_005418 [Coemansia sp. Benny D160-2]